MLLEALPNDNEPYSTMPPILPHGTSSRGQSYPVCPLAIGISQSPMPTKPPQPVSIGQPDPAQPLLDPSQLSKWQLVCVTIGSMHLSGLVEVVVAVVGDTVDGPLGHLFVGPHLLDVYLCLAASLAALGLSIPSDLEVVHLLLYLYHHLCHHPYLPCLLTPDLLISLRVSVVATVHQELLI